MSVLSCSRRGCERIMCDTYIPSVGYVCLDCQNEFKDYLGAQSITLSTEGDIRRALETFMETRKGDFDKGKQYSVDEFFRQYDRKD